ncbi:MAG: long-chain fatty acid--CoA ligase [Muribaculaceae bacterium]|nr:long-chain fatty acid--CoA ligase [Muribaculaceae bacterium]MBQ7205407.1 long-chain fatty acid--CoA ligase [Muribaculaceae bacterium]
MNRFVELIPKQSAKYGDREALRFRDYETQVWSSITWQGFADLIDRAAGALYMGGVEPQGRVCLFTQNCPEVLITHFAAFYNRAIPVPIYATSSKDEAAYIVNDSGATILFVGDQGQYDIARQIIGGCPTLKFIVTLNPGVKRDSDDKATLTWQEFLTTGDKLGKEVLSKLEARKQDSAPDDIMYLIYTSGTTGVPKGVMLMHRNMNAAMDAHIERFDTIIDDKTDVSLSFLPFSHVFELGWTMVCLCTGIRVAINYNPKEIQRAVKEIQPNYMCSVPRFWEKVYTAVNDNLQGAKPVVRMLVKRAISVGKTRNMKYTRLGKKAPAIIERQYQYFEKKVFKKLRGAIGVTDGKLFPTAGAMLSDNITEFLHAVGINICIGYGLSETNASVSFFKPGEWTLGTIGMPISSIQVKIGDKNEILVKGPTVMKGYYNKPQETAEAIDADGWFHTGDCGEIAPTGELILTERLKDLFKTSNGKYIAPQVLETMLGQDKFIEQVTVIGDGRKYVSALIVPDFEELKAYAEKKNISASRVEDLVNNPDIRKMIEERINEYQKGLASYEQIKRFVLLPKAFTMESGELTNTLKIKRAVINKRYRPLIDAMYAADFHKKKDKNEPANNEN